MACVLSPVPLFNHNSCVRFSSDGGTTADQISGDYEFTWMPNTPLDASGTVSCQSTPSRVGRESILKSTQTDVQSLDSSKTSGGTSDIITEGEVIHSSKGVKRKFRTCDSEEIYIPSKRISPFLNTPQEGKEEKRKILKISIQKLKEIDDAEVFLRRSVLINNTMKKMQSELWRERIKQKSLMNYNRRKRRQRLEYDILSNDCLSKTFLYDDPFVGSDKITDDMTDTLMNNLANKLGVSISNLSSVKDKVGHNLTLSETVPIGADASEIACCNTSDAQNQSISETSCIGKPFHSCSCSLPDTAKDISDTLSDNAISVKLLYEPLSTFQAVDQNNIFESRPAITYHDTRESSINEHDALERNQYLV